MMTNVFNLHDPIAILRFPVAVEQYFYSKEIGKNTACWCNKCFMFKCSAEFLVSSLLICS